MRHKINQDKAIELLKKQIAEIRNLKKLKYNDPKYLAWISKTSSLLEKVFGKDSKQLKDFEGIFIPLPISNISEYDLQKEYLEDLEMAEAILNSIKDELIEFEDLTENVKESGSPIENLERIFDKFHLVQRQLQNRHNNRKTIEIKDEYDVQDLLHALLWLFFDDVRPEEWTPSSAGSASRMDFLLKNEKIVIEVKKTRKGFSDKEIGEELIIDIEKYSKHQDCNHLVCFIYDPEHRIKNPRGLENDLMKNEGRLKVSVYIRP